MAFLALFVLAALAQAQTLTTLYSFTSGSGGSNPSAGLIQDRAGNLYGTAQFGGDQNCIPFGCGVVYKLNTAGTETVLHSFSASDGAEPVAPLAWDKAGNIYGTAFYGGYNGSACSGDGCGTVFKIDTAGNETLLYMFKGESDGCWPAQGLLVDGSGNLYGTTDNCGEHGYYGTIFMVDNAGKFALLHGFTGSGGEIPMFGHLTMDKSGDLYGVTVYGGKNTACDSLGCGVLYKLSKSGTFTVLHNFKGGASDGCNPSGTVITDGAGNLYGTTVRCGSNNGGTIWRVTKTGRENILHNFAGGTTDGCDPQAGLTRDSKGNLFGVAFYCGAYGYGVLYELSAKGRFTLLHSFAGPPSDGAYPWGEVLLTTKGRLFSTTWNGGSGSCFYDSSGCGTVWSYVP